MDTLKIDISNAYGAFSEADFKAVMLAAHKANELLHNGQGAGNNFIGWVDLPSSMDAEEIAKINRVAQSLRNKAEVIISVGIGGSYLGAKAVIEAFSNSFPMLNSKSPTVVFAGQNLSEDYIWELLEAVKDKSIAVIVISKSGTTTESSIAFRILRNEIEKRYGKKEATERIVAITDSSRGVLKKLADQEGYETFAIPDDIGGRYSVLTACGLLPIAAAGIDISELIRGARDMERATRPEVADNPAVVYAAVRNLLYRKGFKIEILAAYEPKLTYIGEWWKQLFGESEGKNGKGIFPAAVNFTADLHSMGQYIQDGERTIFETVISVGQPDHKVIIEAEAGDPDGLNYLAGKRISEVNKMAEIGVTIAHVEGGVPNIRIEIPEISPYYIGSLLYFFEKACGISGYVLGVNPFDQPGVENYKRNMFALLDKPGYEEESVLIRKKI